MKMFIQTPYSYNEYIFHEISAICAPLFQHSDIKFFGYMRVFKNGQYFAVSTNLEWQKHFLEDISLHGKEFQKYIDRIPVNSVSNFLWPDFNKNLEDQTLLDLYQYNIWNGISIYRKEVNYIENWSFAGGSEAMHLKNFYINNTQMLNHFINYFNQKAKPFLRFDDAKILSRFDKFSNDFSEDIHKATSNQVDFLKYFGLEGLSFEFNEKEVILSKREMECLSYLSCGRSVKEIASYLNLSPRTIDQYINNVKMKANIHYKSELVSLYEIIKKGTIL